MTAADDLFDAIGRGDLGAVDRLLAARPYLAGASNAAGLTAVTAAAYAGQGPIVERLLVAKPGLDRFEAAIVGDLARLSELLDEPDAEPIDQRSGDGFTALHLAAFFGRLRAAQELLDRGADPNAWASGNLRVQPLHSAVAGRHEQLARLLVERGAQPDQPQRGGFTPLHAAAANGMTALSDFLVEHGANLRALTEDVLTPADLADRAGQPELAIHLRALAR